LSTPKDKHHHKGILDKKYFPMILVLSISIPVSLILFKHEVFRSFEKAYITHTSILSHGATSPNNYRLLVPHLIELIRTIIPGNEINNFKISYFIYHTLSFNFSFYLLYIYLNIWHTKLYSVLGTLITGISSLVAYGLGFFQPWSILEIGLFTAALIFMHRGQFIYLLIITAVSTLNRETAFFIPLLFLLINLRWTSPLISRKKLFQSALLFSVWLIIIVFLRMIIETPSGYSLMTIIKMNLAPIAIFRSLINISLFFGGFWFLLYPGFKRAPDFVRVTWRIVPFYLLMYAIFGLWYEVRLLTLLYPIFVTTGLFGLTGKDEDPYQHLK